MDNKNYLQKKLLSENKVLIPVDEINITKDENKTIGYDFTVKDFYTFKTSDGLFVQDCMAVYIPITKEAIEDVEIKLLVDNNLISPSDGKLVAKPSKDMILGIYQLTKEETDEENFTVYKNEKISKGRFLFNICLPENYPLINKQIDRKLLLMILDDIVLNYPISESKIVLDNIKNLGFKYVTIFGISLSLDDFYNKDLIELQNQLDSDNFENNLNILGSDDVKKCINIMPIGDIVNSGARGNYDQLKQMMFSRGYVTDANNKINKNLIKNNYLNGLNQREFFESCYGVRKGLLDIALSTGNAGHLTRQLVYTSVNTKVSNIEDCNTNDYLEIFTDKDIIKRLLWRYCLDDNNKLIKITTTNYKQFINKKIKVRSPILCECKNGICHKCMGDIHKILHSDKIGIISAQSLSEPIQQLVLKTFHISGAISNKTNKNSDTNEDVINGLKLLQKVFHNPETLGLKTYNDFLFKLYNIFDRYKKMFFIHYEIIISSMMFNKDTDILWRISDNRNENNYNFVSILKVPSRISWLLGCSFANFRRELINTVINNGKYNNENVLTDLFNY